MIIPEQGDLNQDRVFYTNIYARGHVTNGDFKIQMF